MKRYAEALGHGEERVFRIVEVVYQGETRFQRVEIVCAEGYGLVLFLNGQRQSSAADEFIYHEILVHPAMFRHPAPARVFIAGGGEGAVAREVLRHTTVEAVTQVDIDGQMVELCQRYLPAWNAGTYEDPRLQLVIGDALAHLQETAERYDVIFLDLPEWSPETPAHDLYSLDFYRLVDDRLAPGGLMALQVRPVHPVHIEPFLTVIMRPDQQDYQGTGVTVDVARKLDVPRMMLIVNKVPTVFDLGEVKAQVEQTYDCEVAAVLPHSDEMMILASAGIFVLRYPDHPITATLKQAMSRLVP